MKSLCSSCFRLLGILTILGFAVNGFGQTEPEWMTTFQDEVNWLRVAPSGHLIVSTDMSLMGIDRENGEVIWRRDDLKNLKNSPEWFKSWFGEFIPFTSYAVLRIFSGADKKWKTSWMPYYMHLINVADGEDLWNTEALGLKDHYGHFFLPENGNIFLYAKDKDKKETAFMLELESGNVLWQKREFFKKRDPAMFAMVKPVVADGGMSKFIKSKLSYEPVNKNPQNTIYGNQPPYFDTKETMITFMNKKTIRKFNAKTGDLIWETKIKAKHPPALRYGYAPMFLNDRKDILYAACKKTVYAVRTQDGSLVWGKKPKLKGGVSQMTLTPQGLVVKGAPVNDDGAVKAGDKPFFALIDLETGQVVWQDKYKHLKAGTNYVIKDDKIIVFANSKLIAINISDGELAEIAGGLVFEGEETPAFMTLRDDGYYLQSSNNVMLVSFTGEKVFHTYHEAPELSRLEKMALKIAYKGMEALEQTEEEDKETFNKMLGIRFKDNKNLETYAYMLANIETDTEMGVGLVRVNKINGETVDQVILGTRNPVYDVDQFEPRVFFKSNKNNLGSYQLASYGPSAKFLSAEYSKPQTIAVLPTINQTTDVNGSIVFRNLFYKRFEEMKYTKLVDNTVVDSLLNEIGITDGGQLPTVTNEELFNLLNVDGLVFIDLLECKYQTLGFKETRKVMAKFKLYVPPSKFVWADERKVDRGKSFGETLLKATDDLKGTIKESGKDMVKQVAVKGVKMMILDHELLPEMEEIIKKSLMTLP